MRTEKICCIIKMLKQPAIEETTVLVTTIMIFFLKISQNKNIDSGETFYFLGYNRRTMRIFLWEKSSDTKC